MAEVQWTSRSLCSRGICLTHEEHKTTHFHKINDLVTAAEYLGDEKVEKKVFIQYFFQTYDEKPLICFE